MKRNSCSPFRPALVALVVLASPALAQSQLPPSSASPASYGPAPTPRNTGAIAVPDEVSPVEDNAGTSGESAAGQGFLQPFTQSAQIWPGHAIFQATAGYDTALHDVVAHTSAEARLLSFLALRVDFEHGPGMGPTERLGAGARLQLLRQSAHEFDGSIELAYQPNDFRSEGQIVGSLLVGRGFGRLRVLGNLLFGGDPEGDDQAGEARVSALYRVLLQVNVGLDSRFRFNLSEDEKRLGTQTTDWELQSTPTLSLALGPMALLGQAGLSMIRTTRSFGSPQQTSELDLGVVAMTGAAGAF